MRAWQAVEKGLEILDWILAVVCLAVAGLIGAVGTLFGLLSYTEKGDLGGFEWALTLAAVWLVLAGLLVAAALGMRAQARWRWYVQFSPLLAWVVGYSIAICVGGNSVSFGPWTVCGR